MLMLNFMHILKPKCLVFIYFESVGGQMDGDAKVLMHDLKLVRNVLELIL